MMQRVLRTHGAATLAALFFATGCSSSSDGGSTPADTGGATDSAKTDTGGDTAAATPNCEDYCTANIATCTGDLKQYNDKATCMAMCAKMDVGKAGDTAGDTLGCRTYHTGAASKDADSAKTHCMHSGPYGGAVCGDSRCADYCKLAVALCGDKTGATFTTVAACLTDCNAASFDATKPEIDPTAVGKTNCTQYHLEAAALTPDPHCGHLSTTAGPCKAP
jgi:hypothetical protein